MIPVLCHKLRLQALGSTVLCDLLYCLNVNMKALILKLGVLVHPVISALRRRKQEDHKGKANLGYIVSYRPVWENSKRHFVW